jgi:hypothetical protein
MCPQVFKSCKVWLCIIATLNKGQMCIWHVVIPEVKHSLLRGNKVLLDLFYYSLALLSTLLVSYYKRLWWGLLNDWTGLCRSVSQLRSWSAVRFVTTDCAVTCSNLIGHFENSCFLQSFFLQPLEATRCVLSHENSVEINLFVLFMCLNSFLVLHLLCFCFAMKHCITYRYGYLTGRCLLCTDVKKLTLIYTSGTNSYCIFTHTFLWHAFIRTASQVILLRVYESLWHYVPLIPFLHQRCILLVFFLHLHNKAAC